MATPLIPWEPCNIPEELQEELNRRKVNRSIVYVPGEKGAWNQSTGDWNKYRGPMTPWVRFCSNGIGRITDKKGNPLPANKIKKGFVFFGGKDFYSGYGFNTGVGNPSVIGYVPNQQHDIHTIDNDFNTSDYPIHVAPPEVERVSVTIQKELYRRASIEWVCFSKAQLEYMTPYFLVPGITCLVEWGWNHFDPRSLLDLTNEGLLKNLFNNPYPLYTDHIIQSRGNYDVIFGIVTNFEWAMEGNKIKCRTEITSKDRIYSGLLVDASAIETQKDTSGKEVSKNPLDNLYEFVRKNIKQFKAIATAADPSKADQLTEFVKYLQARHPNNWKEYLYGVFYGRDMEDKGSVLQVGANKDYDFDYRAKNPYVWLNLGLVMEIINFHSAVLTTMKGKEIFRIDIDDVVIGAHPNMISTDGTVCLIPNAEAPKYFKGNFGTLNLTDEKDIRSFDVLKGTTNVINKRMTKDEAITKGRLADYQVSQVCHQTDGTYRDNLDEIINRIRYENNLATSITYAFPFFTDKSVLTGSKPYPARYSGYLKHLYVNSDFFLNLLKKSDEIKTYPRLVEGILDGINRSCGNFWNFRLVGSTGKDGLGKSDLATMKVVDYKFMSTANRGTVYTFDYFDADSLLLGVNFKPTLSNAQAIRTIYAPTNNPEKSTTLVNGSNELLDYKFKDRLTFDDDNKNVKLPVKLDINFKETMRQLQSVNPVDGTFQITNTTVTGTKLVRRLVLPYEEVLNLFLDDGDEENNPKYTGIMPNIQASFTIQGIGGLRTFMMFLVRNLPEPYSHTNIVFRIVDVQETIESGKWITTITAGVIPLRSHIKKRLGINIKTTP